MKNSFRFLSLTVAVATATLLSTGCGHSGAASSTPSTDTSSSMGAAPDNNSANNPSLADTNYEKNRTRPITDTMKRK